MAAAVVTATAALGGGGGGGRGDTERWFDVAGGCEAATANHIILRNEYKIRTQGRWVGRSGMTRCPSALHPMGLFRIGVAPTDLSAHIMIETMFDGGVNPRPVSVYAHLFRA